jgi:hypothetical protein
MAIAFELVIVGSAGFQATTTASCYERTMNDLRSTVRFRNGTLSL